MEKRVERYGEVLYFSYASQSEIRQYKQVYIWDLDKTYLDTVSDTLLGFFRTIFGSATAKKNIPGTASLCLSLKSHYSKTDPFPLFFITASPPELKKQIIKKFQLDNLEPKGLFCKDILSLIKKMDFRSLGHQFGYKLEALLQLRRHLGENVQQIMWGDDRESDATIYSLYSDICSRRIEHRDLIKILKALKVPSTQIDNLLAIQSQIPINDPVEKIYINLADDTDTEYYFKFGRRCLPTYNSFQTALDLFQDNRIDASHVVFISKDMLNNFGFTHDEFEASLDDLIRRQVIGEETLTTILSHLQENKLVHPRFEPSIKPHKIKGRNSENRVELEGSFESWIPSQIDYLNNYR